MNHQDLPKRSKFLNKNITDSLESIIERHSVSPGAASVKAAMDIEEKFILIPKADLPKLALTQTPIGERMKARTASYNHATPQMYFDRALDFLAISLYAEKQEELEAERQLDGKRGDAYLMLFPGSAPLWSYNGLPPQTKAQVDVVVKLMTQVDTLKETK
jgi:hypothetical protein